MTGSPRRIAAVGAGLTGAVIARELAEAGFEVDVSTAATTLPAIATPSVTARRA